MRTFQIISPTSTVQLSHIRPQRYQHPSTGTPSFITMPPQWGSYASRAIPLPPKEMNTLILDLADGLLSLPQRRTRNHQRCRGWDPATCNENFNNTFLRHAEEVRSLLPPPPYPLSSVDAADLTPSDDGPFKILFLEIGRCIFLLDVQSNACAEPQSYLRTPGDGWRGLRPLFLCRCRGSSCGIRSLASSTVWTSSCWWCGVKCDFSSKMWLRGGTHPSHLFLRGCPWHRPDSRPTTDPSSTE